MIASCNGAVVGRNCASRQGIGARICEGIIWLEIVASERVEHVRKSSTMEIKVKRILIENFENCEIRAEFSISFPVN